MEDVPGTGEIVLMHTSTRKVVALNTTGAAVWELLDGQRDSSALAGFLAEATGVAQQQAAQDVDDLLNRLREQGFLAPQ